MVDDDRPDSGSPYSKKDASLGARSPADAGAAGFQSILFELPESGVGVDGLGGVRNPV